MASYICIHACNCMYICKSARLGIYVGVYVIFMRISMFLHIRVYRCMCIMIIYKYKCIIAGQAIILHIYIFCDMLSLYYCVGVCI